MEQTLDIQQFTEALPPGVRKAVTQEIVDNTNNILLDPDFREAYRENLISYTSVMADGKFKINNYIDAVRYVSFKLMGMTNIDAYKKTFPEKHARFLRTGVARKDIASYSTAYNKSKLICLIYEQTITPSYVLNQDMYQKALNKQMDLMYNAKSEKVQSDAADSLMNQLKPPEVKKMELSLAVDSSSIIEDYEAMMVTMVQQQKKLIANGGNLTDITNVKVRVDVIDSVVNTQ